MPITTKQPPPGPSPLNESTPDPPTIVSAGDWCSSGNTLDYAYEVEGDTLTIRGGEKGSPDYYRGMFSDNGRTVAGEWVYPGGGG